MKKIIVLIALVVAPIVSYGQSIFDTLEDMDGVSSVIVNKDAFEILSKFNMNSDDNEAMSIFKTIQNLEEFKMFSADNITVAEKINKMVKTHVKKEKLTELMRIKDKDSRVKIYVKAGKNKEFVTEVLMYVSGMNKHSKGESEAMIVSLTGLIDINQLSAITDKITKDGKKH